MKHLYLVDGSGFIFRAYFAIKQPMTRADGTATNAVYGFTRMLSKLMDDGDADGVVVAFDRGRKTFRNDIYPAYKAHRPDPPEDLVPQFALAHEATRALGIAELSMQGFEADDIIATYAKLAEAKGIRTTIVSSDKDLMQLVRGGVGMLDAMKNRAIGPDEVVEKFGVPPEKVVDVQALAGDSTDNVPGVPGIGVKTAAQLIQEYGDLDSLLERADEIKQPKRREALKENADLARVSRDLVRLKDDVPVTADLDAFAIRDPDPDILMAFLKEQNFRSLITQWEARLGASPDDREAETATTSDNGSPAYELVQSEEALQAWVDKAVAEGVVAVDTETTSLNAMRAKLVGVSLAVEPGRACYVPLAHVASAPQGALDLGDGGGGDTADAPDQIPIDRAIAILKPMLEHPGVLKVGQNIKYDAHIFAHHGVRIAPVDDTMLLSYVLEGGLHGHGMDELADLYLDRSTIKYADVAGSGKAQVTFDRVPLDKALDYAAEDADITLRLHRFLKPRLAPERVTTVYETLERPLIPVLLEMERTGILVDAAVLSEMSRDFAARMGDLETQIHSLAGREFNVGSPKQLGEILFDEMGIEGGKKGKTGAYATGADVLEGPGRRGT
jgi:DNA polymerase-1